MSQILMAAKIWHVGGASCRKDGGYGSRKSTIQLNNTSSMSISSAFRPAPCNHFRFLFPGPFVIDTNSSLWLLHSRILLASTPKCLAAASFYVFSAYSTALSFKDTSYALLFNIPAVIRDPSCIAYLSIHSPGV